MAGIRTLVVWCPDWPIVAAARCGEVAVKQQNMAEVPAAVFRANRVVACSAAARSDGVRRGMRRREAQSRSADLVVLAHDPGRDARAFEPVVAAIAAFSPLVEIVRPGRCQLAVRGPARYFGGEALLAEQITLALGAMGVGCQVGIADGPFAAMLAAQQGTHVEVGHTVEFLAAHPIRALTVVIDGNDVVAKDLHELLDLFRRLGLRTLGSFAALPAADVLGRFGRFGAELQVLASGADTTAVDPRPFPPELAVSLNLDPPVDRIDAAAFVARTLAEEVLARLAAEGLACGRVRITARTQAGEELERLWRHESAGTNGGITPTALGDRVRWQLEGWLRASRAPGVDGVAVDGVAVDGVDVGVSLVTITVAPDEVRPDCGRQLDLFGGASAADARAARAFARVQGLLGPDAVLVPRRVGGRSPVDEVALVPWGDHVESLAHSVAEAPWPGRLPGPLPTEVPALAQRADVLDASSQRVRVSSRMMTSAPPAWLSIGSSSTAVVAWAGPWPVDERWWDVVEHRRRARFQLLTADGVARLVALEDSSWWIEATYA
jgi:protein ImuB